MFDTYYDDVVYERHVGRDKTGGIIYSSPMTILVRKVSSEFITVSDKTGATTVKNIIKYHVPANIEIKINDKIDNKIVIDIKASRGIEGKVHFYVVKVV